MKIPIPVMQERKTAPETSTFQGTMHHPPIIQQMICARTMLMYLGAMALASTPNGIRFAMKLVPTWPTMNVKATDSLV